ncbi:hypothetical protein QBC38DRAFT_169433 [Podospora fimiseda]|uniref:Uncharacterized protein n=1 Tax=Podospora fimiseda TaxID=252190 RepID=A0AAN7BR44_9PEZI|nr:hypothetical protein QBC38DRAFT_169433 [Podospora fimiseda]
MEPSPPPRGLFHFNLGLLGILGLFFLAYPIRPGPAGSWSKMHCIMCQMRWPFFFFLVAPSSVIHQLIIAQARPVLPLCQLHSFPGFSRLLSSSAAFLARGFPNGLPSASIDCMIASMASIVRNIIVPQILTLVSRRAGETRLGFPSPEDEHPVHHGCVCNLADHMGLFCRGKSLSIKHTPVRDVRLINVAGKGWFSLRRPKATPVVGGSRSNRRRRARPISNA